MRISDGSSDLCSSDLKFHILAEQQILSTRGYLGCLADKCDEVGAHSCTNIGVNWRTFSRSSFTTCASSSTQAWAANGLARTDRKSAVSGTRASGRVELGGRRIIQKQTYHKTQP